MADSNDWAFPTNLRPRSEELAFDLDAALDAVVLLRAEIPDDAFTASILGTERVGNGIVIGRDGKEVGRLEGPAEWDAPEAQALLRHYLKAGG